MATATAKTSVCPFCEGKKMRGQYLCSKCFPRLPKGTQAALYKQDSQSVERLRLLHSWINNGFKLEEIHII